MTIRSPHLSGDVGLEHLSDLLSAIAFRSTSPSVSPATVGYALSHGLVDSRGCLTDAGEHMLSRLADALTPS